ncbi:hypothetical protein LXJ15735_28120 [Lacrimispora xylanolytica]
MTTYQRTLWHEGRDLWNEYININGYSFSFNEEGINKLSRLLDLNKAYIRI